MAITTTNGKLAVMEMDLDWEPGLPLSPGAFDQADQQQLLWGFPEIEWEEDNTVVEAGGIWHRVPSVFGRILRRTWWGRLLGRQPIYFGRIWRWRVSTVFPADKLYKPVSEDRDYLFNFGDAPEVIAGLNLTAAEMTGGSGLTIGTPAVLAAETGGIAAGEGVSVRISGGTAGTTYTLACKGTLSNGRKLVVTGKLVVEADS